MDNIILTKYLWWLLLLPVQLAYTLKHIWYRFDEPIYMPSTNHKPILVYQANTHRWDIWNNVAFLCNLELGHKCFTFRYLFHVYFNLKGSRKLLEMESDNAGIVRSRKRWVVRVKSIPSGHTLVGLKVR